MTHAPTRWSRRAVTALFASVLWWPHRRAGAQSAQIPLQLALLSLFEKPDSAYAIGQACLNELPRDAQSLHHLESMILASSADAIKTRITYQIGEDFANGSIIVIDGWHLSRTEAQLYVLVAINFPRMA